jgi:hypothetical protein
VWVIGQSDQIARTMLNRAIQPWSASVRPASPTTAIAATRSPQLIAHASTAARQMELAAQLDALAAQPPR